MAKVLIIGSGGREHALGWKLAQSPEVSDIYYAPGNGGTQDKEQGGKGINIPLQANHQEDFAKILEFIQSEKIDLTVVGPEAPLTLGLVDFLGENGVSQVFGPSKDAAQLEADKFFSCEIMEKLDIPQAKSVACRTQSEAENAIREHTNADGIVLKARGLTGGKGVYVCDNQTEAMKALETLSSKYGPEVLVSERLFGQEFSVFAICDGEKAIPLEMAFQDHKALLDGDKGPNTGGMGAYGPAPIASAQRVRDVADQVMTPIVQQLKKEGKPYKGFLYAGMMATEQGHKVLEYNVRFGDPECQPAMMMIANDLYPVLRDSLHPEKETPALQFREGAACCVVLASQGYPGSIQKGLPISGFDKTTSSQEVIIFHAGTRKEGEQILTNGGRVLGVTAYATSGLEQAQKDAYQSVNSLSIEGNFHFRTDIANKAFL